MKYDLRHVSAAPTSGCGRTYVDDRLGDEYERGDRVKIRCAKCGGYGEHEIRGRLKGLARSDEQD